MRSLSLILGILAVIGSFSGLGLLLGPLAVLTGFLGNRSKTVEPPLLETIESDTVPAPDSSPVSPSRGGLFSDKRHHLWLGILLGLAGFTLSLEYSPLLGPSEAAFQEWIGKEASPLELTDTKGTLHRLKDYHGKRVFLVFWSTTCPPCVRELPHLIEISNSLGKDSFQILGLSWDPPRWLKDAVQSKDIPYPVISLSEPLNSLKPPYSLVSALPTLMVISRDGDFESFHVGALSKEELLELAQGRR